jgi:DNA-directed RNA polymerase sigma subunit (sigma70/sigma32)
MNSDKSSNEIAKILESITPQERDILSVKFGITLSENSSLEELVEALSKITHEKIESVEQEALKKLRKKGAPDGSK